MMPLPSGCGIQSQEEGTEGENTAVKSGQTGDTSACSTFTASSMSFLIANSRMREATSRKSERRVC